MSGFIRAKIKEFLLKEILKKKNETLQANISKDERTTKCFKVLVISDSLN
jgi:hypothetical protein